MPKETSDKDEFVRMSEDATECRVKRSGDMVKLKLRTKSYLVTLKTDAEGAEGIISQLKCPLRET